MDGEEEYNKLQAMRTRCEIEYQIPSKQIQQRKRDTLKCFGLNDFAMWFHHECFFHFQGDTTYPNAKFLKKKYINENKAFVCAA